eukprot:3353608-Prymnesium_polylepis.2
MDAVLMLVVSVKTIGSEQYASAIFKPCKVDVEHSVVQGNCGDTLPPEALVVRSQNLSCHPDHLTAGVGCSQVLAVCNVRKWCRLIETDAAGATVARDARDGALRRVLQRVAGREATEVVGDDDAVVLLPALALLYLDGGAAAAGEGREPHRVSVQRRRAAAAGCEAVLCQQCPRGPRHTVHGKASLNFDLALLQALCRRRGSRVSVPVFSVVEAARLDEVVAVVVVQVEGDVCNRFLGRSDVEMATRQNLHPVCTHKGVAHYVKRALVSDSVAM